MKTIIFIFLAAVSVSAIAEERDWLGLPVESNALAWTALFPVMLDWGTTMDLRRKGGNSGTGFTDTNPFLGSNPERSRVNTYFVGLLATHYLINTLPYFSNIKNIWNIRVHWAHAKGGFNNLSAGMEFKF